MDAAADIGAIGSCAFHYSYYTVHDNNDILRMASMVYYNNDGEPDIVIATVRAS